MAFMLSTIRIGPAIAIGVVAGLVGYVGSGTAREQTTSWAPISDDQMGWGTAACKTGDHDAFCFGMRCAGDGAEWFVFQDGGALPEGHARAIVVVDNRLHHSVPMQRLPTGPYAQMAGEFVETRDAGFLEAMRRGQQLYVAFSNGSGTGLTLRGSSDELRRTLFLCGVRMRSER